MVVAILALSVGFYNRYQAEKETIASIFTLSPAEFAIVKKVVESTRTPCVRIVVASVFHSIRQGAEVRHE
jgi:hypothetical protein